MDPYNEEYYDSPIALLKKPIDDVNNQQLIDTDTFDQICDVFGNPLSNTIYSAYRPTYRYLNNIPEWDEGLRV